MAVVIRATAVSGGGDVQGSIRHSAQAAKDCILRAGISVDQVDVLINVGVYRDSNMAEPAMAALIQQEVGMNLDLLRDPAPKAGFSFDLMNGGCGILNAVQVASSFLLSGGVEHVLLVSGDAHPSGRDVAGFPYATAGAAMLLERVSGSFVGFGRLHTATDSGGSPGIAGYLDVTTMDSEGRDTITVEQDADYYDRLVELASSTARTYVEAEGIDLDRTLLVTSQPTVDFSSQVARRLGLAERAAVTVEGIAGDPHSSALTMAYHQVISRGQLTGYEQVLFLTAGSGLSSACVGYRPFRSAR